MSPVRSAFAKVLVWLRVAAVAVEGRLAYKVHRRQRGSNILITGLLVWTELGKLLVRMVGGRATPQVEIDSREMTLAVSPLGVVVSIALALLGCMSDITLSLECLIRGSHGDGNDDWCWWLLGKGFVEITIDKEEDYSGMLRSRASQVRMVVGDFKRSVWLEEANDE